MSEGREDARCASSGNSEKIARTGSSAATEMSGSRAGLTPRVSRRL
jgi:hypothetical protein